MTLIVITCGDCGSHFRLDVALMKESKGIRARCRRCGGNIVVLRPEDLPNPTVAIRPDPEPSQSDKTTVPPFTMPVPKADADSAPAPEETDFVEEIAPRAPERAVLSGGRSHKLNHFIFTAFSILLLAGGTLYFGTTKPGRAALVKFFPGWGSMGPGSVAENPVYDIRDVKWHVGKSSAGESLFVIRGSVANVGNVPSAGIRIQATLLGKDNEALAEKAAFAGNLIDEGSLGKMDRAGIEGFMSTRFGEGNVNRKIPKDKALPFMVVFFDPPGVIEAVVVKAVDAR